MTKDEGKQNPPAQKEHDADDQFDQTWKPTVTTKTQTDPHGFVITINTLDTPPKKPDDEPLQ